MDYTAVSADIAHRVSSVGLEGGTNSAELLGLDPVEGVGAFAMAVGSPKGMPDVVVKVCEDEPYRAYIEAVYSGELTGSIYPVVYSMTEVDGKIIVVMERLVPLSGDRDELWKQTDEFTASEDCKPLGHWISHSPFADDIHPGNIMIRPSTGQLVVIDPVW